MIVPMGVRFAEERFPPDRPVHFLARDYPAGFRIREHRHERGQLVHALCGALTVEVGGGRSWTVPPGRGVWVPPETEHAVRCIGDTRMRTLYVAEEAGSDLPRTSGVVAVTRLLRELILHLGEVQRSNGARPDPHERAVARVAVDLLRRRDARPLELPRPADRRLLRVVAALERDPTEARSLPGWAALAAMSARTLTRAFQRETGMSFGAWRQKLRMNRAIELLASGEPVTSVAYSVGYESLSAFIRVFKRSFGVPPSRYFDDGPAPGRARASRDPE